MQARGAYCPTATTRSAWRKLLVCRGRVLTLICPAAQRRKLSPVGGEHLHLQLTITMSEALPMAQALLEYSANHPEMPQLYAIRFGQLAEQLRRAHAEGVAREIAQARYKL